MHCLSHMINKFILCSCDLKMKSRLHGIFVINMDSIDNHSLAVQFSSKCHHQVVVFARLSELITRVFLVQGCKVYY